MKKRLLFALVLLVALPLVVLALLGARLATAERQRYEQDRSTLLLAQLDQHDTAIQSTLTQRVDTLRRASASSGSPEAVEESLQATGLVSHTFFIDEQGGFRAPVLSNAEKETSAFYNRIITLWRNHDPAFIPPMEIASSPPSKMMRQAAAEAPATQGWYAWYEDDGMHLLAWWRERSNRILGAELDRVRLMADLIAALPDTDPQAQLGRAVLIDGRGQEIYHWGNATTGAGAASTVTLPLAAPLTGWRLDWTPPPLEAGNLTLYLLPLLGLTALIFIAIAVYFYRESTRELRDAAQRVTFVNQVSHELKTPLTNIRMYAELMEEDIEEGSPLRKRLEVIVSESQRLSRLIGNILTFSRKQRRALRLTPKAGRIGETIQGVIENLRPALNTRQITAEIAPPGQEGSVQFDADVLEQILNNLISNVEKYAATGRYLRVDWAQEDGTTRIRIHDRGPGIPKGEEQRIFEPFYRVSNRLTDGVTGTGLGLALARDLARLHGGDLRLAENNGAGCTFELTLHTPAEEVKS
jgi:signal transduction histidine kinase